MEYSDIQARKRENTGKGVARKLRVQGMLPAVLYGGGQDPLAITLDGKAVGKLLKSSSGGHSILNLKVDGLQDQYAMIKDVQTQTMRYTPIHVDLIRIALDKTVEVAVPIQLINTEGIKRLGGVIQQNLNELSVECLPDRIPDSIKVDMAQLEIGDSVNVGTLQLGEGITILDGDEEVIASVLAPKAAEEKPVVAEEGAEATAEGDKDAKKDDKGGAKKDDKGAKPDDKGGKKDAKSGK